MFPDGFESLSSMTTSSSRGSICAPPRSLLVFAVFLDAWDWPARSLAIAAAAGLIFMARQIETVFRRASAAAPARRAAAGVGALPLSALGVHPLTLPPLCAEPLPLPQQCGREN